MDGKGKNRQAFYSLRKVPKNNFSKTFRNSNICSRFFFMYTRNMINKVLANEDAEIDTLDVIDINRKIPVNIEKVSDEND